MKRSASSLVLLSAVVLFSIEARSSVSYDQLTHLDYTLYENVPLSLERSQQTVRSYLEKRHVDLLASYYLASIKLGHDDKQTFWEYTYLLKKPSMHNHAWVLVYSQDHADLVYER